MVVQIGISRQMNVCSFSTGLMLCHAWFIVCYYCSSFGIQRLHQCHLTHEKWFDFIQLHVLRPEYFTAPLHMYLPPMANWNIGWGSPNHPVYVKAIHIWVSWHLYIEQPPHRYYHPMRMGGWCEHFAPDISFYGEHTIAFNHWLESACKFE